MYIHTYVRLRHGARSGHARTGATPRSKTACAAAGKHIHAYAIHIYVYMYVCIYIYVWICIYDIRTSGEG